MKCNFQDCELKPLISYRFCEKHTGVYCIGCGFPALKVCGFTNYRHKCIEKICDKCTHIADFHKEKEELDNTNGPWVLQRSGPSLKDMVIQMDYPFPQRFVEYDFSQIEPRINASLATNGEMLDRMLTGRENGNL